MLQEPRQFCISTDCCHYQSLLSRVIKFKIKGILHVCAILHKAYLLIDQLLYYASPTPSHCVGKPHARMGRHRGRPWPPAGNIESPPSLQLGVFSYQQLPAGNVASSTLPSKAHRVNARILPRPQPSGVPTPLPPDLGAPCATALALLAVVSMP